MASSAALEQARLLLSSDDENKQRRLITILQGLSSRKRKRISTEDGRKVNLHKCVLHDFEQFWVNRARASALELFTAIEVEARTAVAVPKDAYKRIESQVRAYTSLDALRASDLWKVWQLIDLAFSV